MWTLVKIHDSLESLQIEKHVPTARCVWSSTRRQGRSGGQTPVRGPPMPWPGGQQGVNVCDDMMSVIMHSLLYSDIQQTLQCLLHNGYNNQLCPGNFQKVAHARWHFTKLTNSFYSDMLWINHKRNSLHMKLTFVFSAHTLRLQKPDLLYLLTQPLCWRPGGKWCRKSTFMKRRWWTSSS